MTPEASQLLAGGRFDPRSTAFPHYDFDAGGVAETSSFLRRLKRRTQLGNIASVGLRFAATPRIMAVTPPASVHLAVSRPRIERRRLLSLLNSNES
jgi:hypothetical protein